MTVKKNTIIGLIVAAILAMILGLSQFFAFTKNVSDSEEHVVQERQEASMHTDSMREHCRQMPTMRGCEAFNEPDFQMEDYSMDHASMITSEEAFVVNMIPHHQEAVDTSRLIVAKTTNSELKKLAQNIITAQEKEISMMQKWSQDWKYSAQPTYQDMMGDGTQLIDKGIENWYLNGMIMHHQGAIEMAEAVLKLKPRKEVADFARQVINVQGEEITQMKLILGENMMPLSHAN